MKPTARLINAARGGIVDEAALADALGQGVLAAAAADVFEQEPPTASPLLALPNFIATPHIAASTTEAQTSVAFDVAEEVAAVLAGELPRYTVNAPALPPEELAFLRPFALLAERLGSLFVQLEGGRVGTLEMVYEGEVAEADPSLLTAAAVRGLLAPFTEERINNVNARLVAAGRGLRLVEQRVAGSGTSSYPSVVRLRVGDFEASGTVLFGEPRVIGIGAFRVDLVPEGRFLVSRHEDRPGVVGRFGTILGAHDINIASMQVGRDAPRGRAMMLLAVDDQVPDEVLNELRSVHGMSDLRYVELGAPDSLMARVRPFHGIRYTTSDLGPVVSPPYDVIPEEALAGYRARSPYNVVRLIRPGTDYAGAAALKRDWLESGVLREDPAPAFYLHEHRFEGRDRRGLIAAVRLSPYGEGEVLPHERTHGGAKADRLELYRATATAFEPLWFVYRGAGTELPELLDEGFATAVATVFKTDDGSEHRFSAATDSPGRRRSPRLSPISRC